MNNLKKNGFLNALGVLVYVAAVATLITNGDKVFGEMSNTVGPIAFLLLFSLSALVVGTLVLGKPIMFYLDGKKKEAVSLFVGTSIWLAVFTIVALIIAVVL